MILTILFIAGDFAILLNSGMSVKKALLFNTGSSVACITGLIIGIPVGENEEGSKWIFAIASGMFLYISLVDMVSDLVKNLYECS